MAISTQRVAIMLGSQGIIRDGLNLRESDRGPRNRGAKTGPRFWDHAGRIREPSFPQIDLQSINWQGHDTANYAELRIHASVIEKIHRYRNSTAEEHFLI